MINLVLDYKGFFPLNPTTNDQVGEKVAQLSQNPDLVAGREYAISNLDEMAPPPINTLDASDASNKDVWGDELKDKRVLIATIGNDDQLLSNIEKLIQKYLKAGASEVVVVSQKDKTFARLT